MNLYLKNTLAGITTSLAMVPEVVAFAILAHVNPLVGLYAAFILLKSPNADVIITFVPSIIPL